MATERLVPRDRVMRVRRERGEDVERARRGPYDARQEALGRRAGNSRRSGERRRRSQRSQIRGHVLTGNAARIAYSRRTSLSQVRGARPCETQQVRWRLPDIYRGVSERRTRRIAEPELEAKAKASAEKGARRVRRNKRRDRSRLRCSRLTAGHTLVQWQCTAK